MKRYAIGCCSSSRSDGQAIAATSDHGYLRGEIMDDKNKNWSRRDFMKIAGAAGVGAVVSPMEHLAGAVIKSETEASAAQQVPKRPFGKSGVDISILALGGAQNFKSKQILLKQSLKMGVTCWDSSRNYIGGNSEKGIGKYFGKFPQDRKKVFLITKSGKSDPDNLTEHLHESLERMKIDYLDLFLIQAVSDLKEEMTKDIQAWAEKARAAGKIRFFGFSTHKNMENCLTDASRLGWIGGIMATYNYRLMHTDRMQKAVDACNEAGIGIIAMKTQATFFSNLWSDLGKETDVAVELNQHFMDNGFTEEQAKLKSVWEKPDIASICSHMPNMKILQANATAAINKTALSFGDKQLMEQYARATSCGYCTGCAELCEKAIAHTVPISDIMRYLMYYCNYGDHQKAIRLFNDLPFDTRKRIRQINYAKAEQCCPQGMPIAQLMSKAVAKMEC
jgi:predicted aldo/keto reductase-like oxidoreductase